MKINILDAGICYRAGHHYDYGLKLVRHYAQAGHDVHVYGFADMKEEVEADFARFAKVTRLFGTFPYHEAEEYDWFAGELARTRVESARIVEELAGVRDADVWIWPTMRPAEILACTARRVQAPVVGCVYWDPGFEAATIEAQIWRDSLLAAQDAGLRLTLTSVEGELRHRFMRLVPDGRFAVIPHPVDGPPIPQRKTELKRVGFFGHQREEKGAKMMSSLLSRLVDDGFLITFHNSDKDFPFPDVPGIERLDYVENIAVPIAACDLVVLPYSIRRYQARGSGILMECLALGVPVTAPIGTLPGRIVEQSGVGPLFRATSVNPIYGAVKAAERNYGIFSTNAHRFAPSFCKHNGVGRFASALLTAAVIEVA